MRWTPERLEELRRHVAAGLINAEIVAKMGATKWAVGERARQMGIKIATQTPLQREVYAKRAREREANRNARKKAANQAKLIAARNVAAANAPAPTRSAPKPKLGSLELRRVFHIPEMSKANQRAFLAQAVRNTAQMQGGEA